MTLTHETGERLNAVDAAKRRLLAAALDYSTVLRWYADAKATRQNLQRSEKTLSDAAKAYAEVCR